MIPPDFAQAANAPEVPATPPPNSPISAAGLGQATQQTALGAAGNTLDAQVELMKTNMEFMIAMAWLNFVLAVTSKLNGR